MEKLDKFILFLLKIFIIIVVITIFIIINNYTFIKKSNYNLIKNYLSNQQQKTIEYPPWISKCPNGWEIVEENKCINKKKIGNICNIDDNDLIKDFKNIIDNKLELCKWTKKCNITWEGIDKLC